MASGSSSGDISKESRWHFTVEQLQNSPSRKQGIDAEKEIDLRQQAAYLIQEMGQKLRVNQLCINTAIVYMHRFYAFHSFTQFHQYGIAMASLFLAAKVEEQPRKLESVIHVSQACIPSQEGPAKENYQEQAQDLVFNENILLQTLGFDVAVDHPHTHVVKTCQLVKACKDLAQTSYFLASNSLHLTTMCLQYKPTVVACFCIYLACKWSRWEIPTSNEGKEWFYYVDKSVTMELLERLTDEFLAIYERSPARLKNKLSSNINDLTHNARPSDSHSSGSQHRSSSHHRSSSSSHHQNSLKQQSSSSGSASLHSSSQSGRHHRNERDRNAPPDRPANVPPRSSSSSNGPIPARSTSNPMRPQSISSREMQRNVDSSGHHRASSSSSSSHHQQMKQRPTTMHSSNTNNNSSNSNNTNNNATNQQKQQMLSVQNSQQQKPQPTLIDMSSFGGDISAQLDDINTMDLLNSPPKQQMNAGKAPSIFSPEWNDKSNSSNNGSNLLGRMEQQQGSNGSEAHDSIHSNDPIKKEKSTNDQHHQQQQQQSHRTSMQTSDKMMSLKREMAPLSGGIQYDASLPHNLLDNKAAKRPYNSEQMQLDSNEYQQQRDVKMRKVESMSPTHQNLVDPSGKLGMGTKAFGASSLNGIETNPDLVSSLLKESLSDSVSGGAPTMDAGSVSDKKLTTTNTQDLNQMAGYNAHTSNMDQQQHSNKSDAFDQAMSTQYSSNQHMQYNKHMDADITNQSQRMQLQSKSDEQNQQFDSLQQRKEHQKLKPEHQFQDMHQMAMQHHPHNLHKNSQDQQLEQVQQQAQRPAPNHGQYQHLQQSNVQSPHYHQQQQQPQPQPQPQQLHSVNNQMQLPAQLIVKSDSAERIKSEKKKKKEKHKNKDKEKTKNREDRKKHKKDKDRSKDKSKMQQSGHSIPEMPNNTKPIRIKIAKDKLNLSQTDHHNLSSGYSKHDSHSNLNDGPQHIQQHNQQSAPVEQQIKLKIPKDRIKTDPQMNLNAMNHNTVQAPQATTSTPTSLKIKIPKDVIENYANTSQQNYSNETGHIQNPSKKKDKNRDRDKSMRNSSSNMPNSTKMLSQNDQSHQSHTHLAQSIFADERDRDSMPDMWGQHKLTQQQQIQHYQVAQLQAQKQIQQQQLTQQQQQLQQQQSQQVPMSQQMYQSQPMKQTSYNSQYDNFLVNQGMAPIQGQYQQHMQHHMPQHQPHYPNYRQNQSNQPVKYRYDSK